MMIEEEETGNILGVHQAPETIVMIMGKEDEKKESKRVGLMCLTQSTKIQEITTANVTTKTIKVNQRNLADFLINVSLLYLTNSF